MNPYPESHDGDDFEDEERSDFAPEVLDVIEQAWESFEADEIERAMALFQEARDLEPDNPAIEVEMAEALFELGRFDEVVALTQPIVTADPTAPRARRLLALALHERGESAEAQPLIEAEMEETPEDALLWVSLGDVLGAQGQHDRSMEAYQQALDLDSNAWGAHHGWGLCLVQQENYAAAIDHYRAALAIEDNLPEVHLAWGELLITLSDWKGARERLLRAVHLDEEYAEAWEALSFVCDHLGDRDEAFTILRRAVFWNPEQEELLGHLATNFHPHCARVELWEITAHGRYIYPDAVPPERAESHRFRRIYRVWATDQSSAVAMIEEIESAMWDFEYSIEEMHSGQTATNCHPGVFFLSERLYESTIS